MSSSFLALQSQPTYQPPNPRNSSLTIMSKSPNAQQPLLEPSHRARSSNQPKKISNGSGTSPWTPERSSSTILKSTSQLPKKTLFNLSSSHQLQGSMTQRRLPENSSPL